MAKKRKSTRLRAAEANPLGESDLIARHACVPQKRLQSAEGWIKNYEGKKLIKAYRKRYGVDWESAFKELAMLGVPIDPKYKESVLRSAANQLAAKRRKKLVDTLACRVNKRNYSIQQASNRTITLLL